MKTKTTMQQLIDEIVEHLTYDDDLSDDSRITYETIRLVCLGKLKLEKQQIIEAYCMGDDSVSAEEYYKQTYNL